MPGHMGKMSIKKAECIISVESRSSGMPALAAGDGAHRLALSVRTPVGQLSRPTFPRKINALTAIEKGNASATGSLLRSSDGHERRENGVELDTAPADVFIWDKRKESRRQKCGREPMARQEEVPTKSPK